MTPRITFYGAAGEVTGSCHMLETAQARLLLDCGMFQGGREAERRNAAAFSFYPSHIDAVVLSHAHIDHSGLLPRLVAEGFNGPIYCTPATRDLLWILLRDSAMLQEKDIQWENKKRQRAGRRLLEPLYGLPDVYRTLERCRPLPYGATTEIADGVTLRFFDAGHILGSASIELVLDVDGRAHRLLYSGDIGNPDSLLMHDSQVPDEAVDSVIMESTYGDRDHQSIGTTREQLAAILQQAHQQHGNVLIPSFAVERTQEVIYDLAMLRREGRLPQRRVYLDSPMAIEVSALYFSNLAQLDPTDIARLTDHGRQSIGEVLDFIYPTRSTEDSMALNQISGGLVIIAGSGMCDGGRIRHHLKYNLWRREAQVVIVGFQAAGTLGRKLVDGAQRVKILSSDIAVRAKIHTLGGYSAHAGRRQLLQWAASIKGTARFYLVHGETGSLEALADALKARNANADIQIPQRAETLKLGIRR